MAACANASEYRQGRSLGLEFVDFRSRGRRTHCRSRRRRISREVRGWRPPDHRWLALIPEKVRRRNGLAARCRDHGRTMTRNTADRTTGTGLRQKTLEHTRMANVAERTQTTYITEIEEQARHYNASAADRGAHQLRATGVLQAASTTPGPMVMRFLPQGVVPHAMAAPSEEGQLACARSRPDHPFTLPRR